MICAVYKYTFIHSFIHAAVISEKITGRDNFNITITCTSTCILLRFLLLLFAYGQPIENGINSVVHFLRWWVIRYYSCLVVYV